MSSIPSRVAARAVRRFLAIQKLHHISSPCLTQFHPLRSALSNYVQNTSPSPPSRPFRNHHHSTLATSSTPPPSIFNSPTRQVRVAHILLPPDTPEPLLIDLKSQIEQAEDSLTKLQELAKELSKCPSASRGGDIGWIPRGRTAPEFEAAAYSTPKGGIAECRTNMGVHLMIVMNDREAVEIRQCSVNELGELLASSDPSLLEDIQFVDVREISEVEIASIPQFKQHIFPLSAFQNWASQVESILDKEKEIMVLCHHGVRSMQFSHYLVDCGFKKVTNITGGIDAYSRGVDQNIPLY